LTPENNDKVKELACKGQQVATYVLQTTGYTTAKSDDKTVNSKHNDSDSAKS